MLTTATASSAVVATLLVAGCGGVNTAGVSNDGPSGVAPSDALSDGVGPGDAAAAPDVPSAAGCVPGLACFPGGNLCRLGTIACAAGGASCVDNGAATDGKDCGNGRACSAGTCLPPAPPSPDASPAPSCTPDLACAPGGNACRFGVVRCAPGGSTCEDKGAARDGSDCGAGQVCRGGVCAAKCPDMPGLIAWWDGDAVQGDRVRDIKGGYDGTMKGSVKLAPGMVGQAFEFTGGEVVVPDAPALTPKGGLTIEAWVQAYGYNTNARIISKQLDDLFNSSYILGVFEAGRVYFGLFAGGGQTHTSQGTPYPIRKWAHVAATWDGREMRSYFDGKLQQTLAFAGPITVISEPLRIGKGDGTRYGFSGLVDEVALYDRALSPAEIQAIVFAGAAGKCKPVR